ncbi:MAG: Ig-like domain-containing protein [Bacteroidota bacterium]
MSAPVQLSDLVRRVGGLLLCALLPMMALASPGPGQPPTFTSSPITTATQGQLYVYNVTTESSVSSILLTAPVLPSWLSFTDNGDGTGVLQGTPTNSFNASVRLVATDDTGSQQQLFTIVVSDPNDPPTFTSTPVTTATVGEPYTYVVTAEDPNQDQLTLTAPSISETAPWLTFEDNGNGTGLLSGTPPGAFNYGVSISLSDGQETIAQTFTIVVSEGTGFTSCADVTDVPLAECEALVAFYNAADGPNWANNTNWLTTTTVGSWFGVSVVEGNVSDLEVPNNLLTGSVSPSVTDLTLLGQLVVRGNQLSGVVAVPSGLSVLDVSDNLFTFDHLLPAAILAPNSFTYTPQAEVGTPRSITLAAGAPMTFAQAVGGAETYQWYRNGDPIDGATSPVYMVGAVTPADAGTYFVEAFNSVLPDLVLRGAPVNVTITAATVPPSFTSTPITTAQAGVPYAYLAAATNDDGSPASLTGTQLPSWLSFTDNGNGTGLLAGTPPTAGSFNVELTASDGSLTTTQAFTITVTSADLTPPVALDDAGTTPEDTALIVDVLANDTDADGTLDLTSVLITQAPSNGTATAQSDGRVRYAPADGFIGTDTFNYTVADNDGARSNDATVTIVVTPDNAPPVFTSVPQTAVQEGEDYTYDVQAQDPDNDPLTFTAPTLPGWLSFSDSGNGTAMLSGRPTEPGDYDVVLEVSDGLLTAEQAFTITVSQQAIVPPVAVNDEASTAQDQAVLIPVLDNDTDADGVLVLSSVTIAQAPSNGRAVPQSDGQVRYEPDAGYSGQDRFTYTVRDNDGARSNVAEVTVLVAAGNTAPQFTSTPITTAQRGVDYRYEVTAEDADGDPITLTAPTLPPGLSFADNGDGSGLVSGAPTREGLFEVILRASDGEGSTDQAFNLTITSAPANTAPRFTSVPITTAQRGADYRYEVTTEDAEGDPITLTAPTLPPGLSFADNGNGSGLVSGAPTREGLFEVVLRASDGEGSTDQGFNLTITGAPANTAPRFTSVPVTTAERGVAYRYEVTAEDTDGDSITLTAPTLPPGLSFTDNGAGAGLVSGAPTRVGVFEVVLRASDGEGSTDQGFNLTITVPAVPPRLAPQGLVLVPGDEAVTATWSEQSHPTLQGYRVYWRRMITGPTDSLDVNDAGATSALITGLTNGVAVYVAVSGLYTETAAPGGLFVSVPTSPRQTVPLAAQLTVSQTQPFGDFAASSSFRIVSVPGATETRVASTFTGTARRDWDAYWDAGQDGATWEDYLVPIDDSPLFTFVPGRAFWAISTTAWQVNEEAAAVPLTTEVVGIDTLGTYAIALHPGWNLIGNPFEIPVRWSDVEAVQGQELQALFAYEGSFREETVLTPYQGYYYFNTATSGTPPTTVRIPYRSVEAPPLRALGGAQAAKQSTADARLQLQMATAQDTAMVEVLVVPSPSDAPIDRVAPPGGMGRLDLALVREGASGPGHRAAHRLQRAVQAEAQGTYELRVIRRGAAALDGATLSWQAEGLAAAFPGGVLVDARGRTIGLDETASLALAPVRGEAQTAEAVDTFWLIVGAEAHQAALQERFRPQALHLETPYPNPSSGSVRLGVAVPDGSVRVVVYDLLGRRVRTLADGPASRGWQELTWDGRDDAGRTVAAGVYLVAAESASGRVVRRLTRIR